jgi:hypothetical protein
MLFLRGGLLGEPPMILFVEVLGDASGNWLPLRRLVDLSLDFDASSSSVEMGAP